MSKTSLNINDTESDGTRMSTFNSLEIPSNRVNPWDLMLWLRGKCGKGNFRVEMRQNIYKVYFRGENANLESLRVDLVRHVLPQGYNMISRTQGRRDQI